MFVGILALLLCSVGVGTAGSNRFNADAITWMTNLVQSLANALVNMFIAPINALTGIWNSWASGFADLGIWGPVLAVVVIMIVILVIALFLKMKKFLPG